MRQKKIRSHGADLREASRLAVAATKSVTTVVEKMHHRIASGPGILGKPLSLPMGAYTRVVYGTIRAATHLVGAGLDALLAEVEPLLGESAPGLQRDAVLAALNGVLGDYLVEHDSPFAMPMEFRVDGASLELTRQALGESFPHATGKLLVLVHGSSMNDTLWRRAGHDHGESLARDAGYTAVYLRYNSGLHISTNGQQFAKLLNEICAAWPVPISNLSIVGHSMGGLVTRSACHVAEEEQLSWRKLLRNYVSVGTPHHGATLERGGNLFHVLLGLSDYSSPLMVLARIRSAGVTDLRYGYVLDENWRDVDRFAFSVDARRSISLPENVDCFAIAGTTTLSPGGKLANDGVVEVSSALGQHKKPELTLRFAADHQWTAFGTSHLDLLNSPEVYEKLRAWLA